MEKEGKENPRVSEPSTQAEAASTPAPGRLFKRLRVKSKVTVVSLGAVAAAIIAVGTLVYYVWQGYVVRREKTALAERCKGLIKTARDYASRDDFDESLRLLNGEVKEFHDLVEQCKQNKDMDMLRREVGLFKIASEYDQFTLVDGDETLKNLETSLAALSNMPEAKDFTEFDTLSAVIEDLRDHPNDAETLYRKIEGRNPNYANLFNHWGYTIFRWRLGGGDWSDRALEKFARAAQLNMLYMWPHINAAAVFLSLAEDEMEKKEPQFANVETNLRKANESLDRAADALNGGKKVEGYAQGLTKQPRLAMLYARYNLIRGQIHQRLRRSQDAARCFYRAEDYLLHARGVNDKNVDVLVLLGSVYEELWLTGRSPEMQEKAIDAFRGAVALDRNNLEASMRLAYSLNSHSNQRVKEQGAQEAKRGLALLSEYRRSLNNRLTKTGNQDAHNWLHDRLNLLVRWEANFIAMLGKQAGH